MTSTAVVAVLLIAGTYLAHGPTVWHNVGAGVCIALAVLLIRGW